MYSIILDAFIILMFIFAAINGFKKGFVKSVLNLLGAIGVLALAIHTSDFTADYTYKNFIQPAIESKFEKTINSSTDTTKIKIPESLVNVLPATQTKIDKIISDNAAKEASQKIAKLISAPVITILKVICVAGIFLILMIPVKIISSIISKIFKLPFLKQVNGTLGLIFGVLKYFLILSLATFIIKVTIPMWSSVPEFLSSRSIESSVLFKRFYNDNLISNYIKV